jgi:hypothetical protein|tara:strand:- start:1691 stop:1951 length:261 start_codon:yes stop_codon:yes gene_type:complete
MICPKLNPKRMLAIIKLKRDTECSLQRMHQEQLLHVEKSEQKIGEIRVRRNLLEKQVEEWCEESPDLEMDKLLSIEPLRYSDAPCP